MSDVEVRLQQLRSKQQDAQRRYAQAEAKLDAVRSQKETLLAGLKENGWESVEAARERVQALSAETQAILEKIEQQVVSL